MKRNSVTLYALGVLVASTTAVNAQESVKDSTMNRELLLEKEYNPIVRDADKINKLPAVEAPQSNKTKIVYSDLSVTTTPVAEIRPLSSGDVQTGYEYSKKRGYFNIGYGNYNNLNGDLGFRFIDKEKNVFGIEYTHRSSNGEVSVPDMSDVSTKLKLNDNFANLYYRHFGEKVNLASNVYYDNRNYNYYGYLFPETPAGGLIQDEAPKQTLQQFGMSVALESAQVSEWEYKGKAGFYTFHEEYNDLRETSFDLGFGLGKTFDNWKLDFGLNMNAYLYNTANEYYGSWENNGVLKLKPAFKYDNEEGLKATLGLNADVAFGRSPKFGVAPEVRLDWEFAQGFFLYSDITGGLDPYAMAKTMQENRYYMSANQLDNKYTVADLSLGLRSNKVGGFWFDIYTGWGYVKNDAEFYTEIRNEYFPVSGTDESQTASETRLQGLNTLDAQVVDLFRWRVGARMSYSTGSVFTASLKIQKNGWTRHSNEDLIGDNVENAGDAQSEWGDKDFSYKPGFEVQVAATIRPVKKLVLDVNYNLYADRKATIAMMESVWENGTHTSSARMFHQKMKNINDLNLKATWLFNDTFSIFAAANNLTFQKYDIYYGMPAQRFNFQAGGSIRF